MPTNSFRKRYINTMLLCIEDIADREYQKRVWIQALGPEVDDFEETINVTVPSIEWVLREKLSFKLSDEEIIALEKFCTLLDSFKGSIYEEKDLELPEWLRITEEAAKVLKVFKYLGQDKFKHVPNLSDAEKKQWLESFLQNVALLADEDYQKRIWVRKENTDESNYENVRDDFFEDVHGFLKYANEFQFTDLQINQLKKFKALLSNFGKQFGVYADQAAGFIDKPEWKHVMEKARELLEIFHYSTSDNSIR